MLPATTRKSLRIPHHLAILAAGVSLAIAFYVDFYQGDSDHSISLTQVQTQTDHSTAIDSATNAEQRSSETRGASRIRFDLPRLLPWAKPQPRSE